MAGLFSSHPTFENQIRWKPYYNDSSETVPAYGVIKVTDSTSKFGQSVLTGDKPDATDSRLYAINHRFDIGAGKYGRCAYDTPVKALYDTADGTPANNELWGPESGSWKLVKYATGFQILGGVNTDYSTVMVQAIPAPARWHWAKLDGTLSAGGSATASIWNWNGSALVDSGNNVTVYDWLLGTGETIASGKKIKIDLHLESQRWYVTSAECP